MGSVAKRAATTALSWLEEERPVALCMLAVVEGSAPLAAGAMMFVDGEEHIEGSISGGCVESEVVHEALDVLAGGSQPRLLRYGIADASAGSAGLMCGGTVQVLVQAVGSDDEAPARYLADLVAGEPVGMATLLDGDTGSQITIDAHGKAGVLSGSELLGFNVEADLRSAIDHGRSALRRYGSDGARLGGEVRVQIAVQAQPPQLVIVGAVDFAAALAPMAAALGYEVTICDPRTAFLSSPRFNAVAHTVARWPDDLLRERALQERDAVLVFSHDPKLDVPAVIAALESPAGYVGALGSRRTSRERELRLLEAGVTSEALARLHAPCGLDIGSATPEETAVAILGEIVADRAQRLGGALRDAAGPIRARQELAGTPVAGAYPPG